VNLRTVSTRRQGFDRGPSRDRKEPAQRVGIGGSSMLCPVGSRPGLVETRCR
jgi:hypothetical protein